MKYIKTYEWKSIIKPKVGDYVVCKLIYTISDNDDFINFIENTIGRIEERKYDEHDDYHKSSYIIRYKNIPSKYVDEWQDEWNDDEDNVIIVCEEEIKYYSDNKKELRVLIDSKKYNIL